MAFMNLACVQVLSDINGAEKCGYCKKSDTHYLEGGIWTFNFSPQHEEYLLNYGWRRCGNFIYVIDKCKNCCPLYMIRCDAENFKISHSQKKVLRKITNYLKGSTVNAKPIEKVGVEETISPVEGACNIVKEENKQTTEDKQIAGATPLKKQPRKGTGYDPSKGPCLKAKERRKLKSKNLTTDQQTDADPTLPTKMDVPNKKANIAKTVEDYLNDQKFADGFAHKLETRLILVNPESPEYKSTEKESHRIYQAYQQKIHEDPPDKNTLDQYKRFLVTSKVTPLEGEGFTYGCYHQQYFIDGKLFMVGVLDILPNYISSVYTFYDPEFMFLSPGVFSALNEIALTRKLQLDCASKKWYCMGFYVHTIQKMRYKGEYFPSYLNCPFTHNWIEFEKCLPLLETGKYKRLDDTDREAIPTESYFKSALMLHSGDLMPYSLVLESYPNAKSHEETIKKYCELVGPEFCQNTIAIFDFFMNK